MRTLPRFGQRVVITAKLIRRADYTSLAFGTKKFWEKYSCAGEGILIGYRTLSDGVSYYNSLGISYESGLSFKAALVVLSPRTNPVYVPLDCLEVDE